MSEIPGVLKGVGVKNFGAEDYGREPFITITLEHRLEGEEVGRIIDEASERGKVPNTNIQEAIRDIVRERFQGEISK